MEKEIADLEAHLLKYKDSHPNFSLLWREYIKNKVDDLKKVIQDCKTAMDNIDTTADLTHMNIMTLYILNDIERDLHN